MFIKQFSENEKLKKYLSRRVLSSLSLSIRISFCRLRCWLSASRSSLRRAFSSVLCCASLRASSSSYKSVFFSISPRKRPTSWVWSVEPGAAEDPACFNWIWKKSQISCFGKTHNNWDPVEHVCFCTYLKPLQLLLQLSTILLITLSQLLLFLSLCCLFLHLCLRLTQTHSSDWMQSIIFNKL